MDEIYLVEINEWTDKLRHAESWANARAMLEQAGFAVDTLLLVAFAESEECKEYGVFLTADKRVLQWIVDTNGENVYGLECIDDKTGDTEFYKSCPQVPVGLNILDKI